MKERPLSELLAEAAEREREVEELRRTASKQIGHLRRSSGMTQDEFAQAVGRSQSYVSQVESLTRTPSTPTLTRMYAVLSTTSEGSAGGTSYNAVTEGGDEAEGQVRQAKGQGGKRRSRKR